MVLTVCFVLSPVNGLVATVPAQCKALSRVDANVATSGPHDFTVRFGCARLAQLKRPSHPAPTCRDDRETPLDRARDGSSPKGDLPDGESGKFL
jgi:hypothetical protein